MTRTPSCGLWDGINAESYDLSCLLHGPLTKLIVAECDLTKEAARVLEKSRKITSHILSWTFVELQTMTTIISI